MDKTGDIERAPQGDNSESVNLVSVDRGGKCGSGKGTSDEDDEGFQEVGDGDKAAQKFGWRVNMDHKWNETWDSTLIPRLRQIPDLLPLFLRFVRNVDFPNIYCTLLNWNGI